MSSIPNPPHPVIRVLKKIAEQFGYTHLVLFAYSPKGGHAVATWGMSEEEDQAATREANSIMDTFGFDPKYHIFPGNYLEDASKDS
jgi:hypothetical protein